MIDHFKVPVNSPHPIQMIEMVPSGKGRFDVEVEGKVVFSKYESGRHAEPGEIIAKVQSMMKA